MSYSNIPILMPTHLHASPDTTMDLQILSEAFPPAAQWTAEDVPDLSGKVVAVTGGYGGVGYHTVVRPPLSLSCEARFLTNLRSLSCDVLDVMINRKHASNETPKSTSSVVHPSNLKRHSGDSHRKGSRPSHTSSNAISPPAHHPSPPPAPSPPKNPPSTSYSATQASWSRLLAPPPPRATTCNGVQTSWVIGSSRPRSSLCSPVLRRMEKRRPGSCIRVRVDIGLRRGGRWIGRV
jgi:hypothetical protein